jgi:serine/tyrosine/threonine adenylyltransferase
MAEEKSASGGGWRWEGSYAGLPEALFARVVPEPVARPGWVFWNRGLAAAMGLEEGWFEDGTGLGVLAGNVVPEGCDVLAQAYAGHQFGHFTMLGDGRAVLLGEHRRPDGRVVDVALKGAGRTPYSRSGDGRAALGPMVREHVVSEAMHALGIPTTRSLAVVSTGETVWRDGPLAGAILARVAASHVRVGTFEYAAALGDEVVLRSLADHTVARHFPEKGYEGMLREVVRRQARLVARWMGVGFVHGVMNTDNMALSGETIDYGPCAFLDRYESGAVFSSIDRGGRYAYGNQPRIAQWNLARLAEAMLPLIGGADAVEAASALIEGFGEEFRAAWLHVMRTKLGLRREEEGDGELVQGLFDCMEQGGMDFTNTFRGLDPASARDGDADFQAWHGEWRRRLDIEGRSDAEVLASMRAVNPAVIPRNHKLEEALEALTEGGDALPVERMLAVLANPYDDPGAEFTAPPPAGAPRHVTFCGT